MIIATLEALARAAGGRILAGRPELPIHGIFTDTRAPLRGGLFVALRGDNFNGNLFAHEAIVKGGAAAVLLDSLEPVGRVLVPVLWEKSGVILVEDSREGFLGIAAQRRRKLSSARWLGITGSVGKSSTKEMLAHILAHALNWNVHKAKASFNNAVGLAQTILGAEPGQHAVVLELGTNHPGEIKTLAAVARPDIAVITCVAEAHLEAFGSLARIAAEKGQILAAQNENGTAVLNADDPHFILWRSMAKGKVLTFGQSEKANVQAKQLRLNSRGCAEFKVRHGEAFADCSLRILGAHQANNALAAIAAAIAAGASLEDAVKALASFEGISRRLTLKEVRGYTLIDDAYNANPTSFAAALVTLKRFNARRKFLVAGDMLELGENAAQYHRELGRLMAGCGLDTVVTVGALASLAGESAAAHRNPSLKWVSCTTPEEAAEVLRPSLRPGDVVLLKGSHGMHLEECVKLLSA
jgi:UDP-N-acetylmuramoyl-tripeptide--D-alanyl-D-alanine ligase